MTDLAEKINGSNLTDAEVRTFFNIAPDCDDLHDSLDAKGTQYSDGGDVIFWITGSYYLEPLGADDWFVKDMRWSKDDTDDDIASHGIAAYHSDNTTLLEALSLFGLDHHAIKSLNRAGDDYNGLCQVWVCYNYYSGHLGVQHSNWLTDDHGNPLIFDNKKEALSEINVGDIYILGHNESSPPDYYVVEV